MFSGDVPEGVEEKKYFFLVSLLDQIYWVFGTVLGSVLGSVLNINTEGIDFSMTALFVVILLNQWLDSRDRRPALAGLGASLLCLALFGPENFILPAMALILTVLTVFRRKLEPPEEGGGSA